MRIIEKAVFGAFVLGALSVTQTDTLARGHHHEEYHREIPPAARDLASHEDENRDLASRPKAVYAYPDWGGDGNGDSYVTEEDIHVRTVTPIPSSKKANATGIERSNGVTTVDLGSGGIGTSVGSTDSTGGKVQGQVTKGDVVARHPESDEQTSKEPDKQATCATDPTHCTH